MRVLLDISSFLWFVAGSDRLSREAREIMEDFDNELVISVASLWEIAIKVSIGKLELLRQFDLFIPEKLEENEIEILHVTFCHLSEMIKLPFHHRDPFDRLIIAQSVSENLPLIASDRIFREYSIDIIW
jgi:PIN domain nuclease of toxin-antitoxin system